MQSARLVGSWALSLFLAAMFFWLADQTLFPVGSQGAVVFRQLAEISGFPYWDPTGRVIVAGLEILAACLLLIPAARLWGAWLCVFVTAGAIAAHGLWLGIEIQLSADPVRTDGGQLFNLALALFAASILLLRVLPRRREP
ncbi:MAG: hypothetical protein KGS00_05860 [Alphaproteobacteria bacterium]|nr:hypothetical protein [Alphaproteobacteria bacterium]